MTIKTLIGLIGDHLANMMLALEIEIALIGVDQFYKWSQIYFQFANSIQFNALCVRLNRKWEIGIFPPLHPFSPGIIISDIIIGGCPLSSFTFDIYLGTS